MEQLLVNLFNQNKELCKAIQNVNENVEELKVSCEEMKE
jgi:hypothetical protein